MHEDLMMIERDIGDMLIEIGRRKHFDDSFKRVFLYLFAKIVENHAPSEQLAILNPNDAALDLGIPYEIYQKCVLEILTHCFIKRTILEDAREQFTLNFNDREWIFEK